MKIQIVSDLHFEFALDVDRREHVLPAGDVLVIAGDMCYLNEFFEDKRVQQFVRYTQDNWERVLYVPGNHEYYESTITDGLYMPDVHDPCNLIELSERPAKHVRHDLGNFSIVNNDVITIKDVNFACSTLWTQLPPQHEQRIKSYLTDFRLIGKMNPNAYNTLNRESVTFLRTECAKLDNVVIVSHHLPSWKTVSDPYRSDPLSYGFTNTHLDNLLYPSIIKAWIHGHSHDAIDIDINGVRVIRNPFGYEHEWGKNGYCKQKVIEV